MQEVVTMAYSCYAVRNGRKTGIFTNWKDCQAQIFKFPNASYKGFDSKSEAKRWLDATQPCFKQGESTYEIYTDGSCLRNPGHGGWATVILCHEEQKELSGYECNTTNNRMELMAVIMALQHTEKGSSIILYTDSQYIQKAFTEQWIINWKKNGWRNAHHDEVANKDLWIELLSLVNERHVDFRWVKGHDGNVYNERCDKLAVIAAHKAAMIAMGKDQEEY